MRHVLIDIRDAELGSAFLKAYKRIKLDEEDPLGKLFKKDDMVHNYSVVAQHVFEVPSYKDMPQGCRSFVGMCASMKKEHPSWTFEQCMNQALHNITVDCNKLWEEVRSLANEYEKIKQEIWRRETLPLLEEEWHAWVERDPLHNGVTVA